MHPGSSAVVIYCVEGCWPLIKFTFFCEFPPNSGTIGSSLYLMNGKESARYVGRDENTVEIAGKHESYKCILMRACQINQRFYYFNNNPNNGRVTLWNEAENWHKCIAYVGIGRGDGIEIFRVSCQRSKSRSMDYSAHMTLKINLKR